jgi:LysM repeat protein
MPEHIVRHGDTLSGITHRYHIRYWPNIFLAPENYAFRDAHPKPDLIFPGDRVQIPSAASIAPMERKPGEMSLYSAMLHRHQCTV